MVERFVSEAAAAVPELTIEQKYAVMGVEVGEQTSLYANPELSVAGRFAESIAPATQSKNPELMVVGRFVPEAGAAVPELTIEEIRHHGDGSQRRISIRQS